MMSEATTRLSFDRDAFAEEFAAEMQGKARAERGAAKAVAADSGIGVIFY
jgi:hypothetical protein